MTCVWTEGQDMAVGGCTVGLMQVCSRELRGWFKQNARTILIIACIGFAVHFTLYANSLTNPDGLWKGGGYDYYNVRGWDYALGRWAWFLTTKLRGGVCTPGLMVPLVIFGFAVGTCLIADALRIERRSVRIALGAVVICSPLLACTLTYYPYNDIYSLAFLLSALAVTCQRFDFLKLPLRMAISALAVCVAVGFYQSTIGVTCALILMALIVDLLCAGADSPRTAFKRFAIGALSILIGCLLYVVVMKATMAFVNVTPPSYRGASNVSLSYALSKLATSIPYAYESFYSTLFSNDIFGNHYLAPKIMAALLIAGAVAGVLCAFRSRKVLPVCTSIVSAALIPLAAMVICVVVPDTGEFMPLMVGGALITPYLPVALLSSVARKNDATPMVALPASESPQGIAPDSQTPASQPARHPRLEKALGAVGLVLACCLAWSYTLQVNCDSSVQYKLDQQFTNLATQIVGDINRCEEYTSSMKVAVVGLPKFGNYPLPAEADMASTYVRRDTLMWGVTQGSEACWEQLFKIKCGVTYNYLDYTEVWDLAHTDEFEEMPNYPARGSIRVIDDVLVVKVSDYSKFPY